MSVSATTAAKRRRAGNIVSSPLFKPTSAPIENSVPRRTNMSQLPTPQYPSKSTTTIQPTQQEVTHQSNAHRPMSLQQVISVFDKRLLHIESYMLNNTPLTTNEKSLSTSDVTKDMETLKTSIRENLDGQFSEFDHRYQVLATELSNIKQVVLKLQTYTLEINKSLMDERTTILSQLSEIQEKLKNGTSIDACTNTENSEENIQFAINDVSQELLEAQQDNLLEQEMETENKEEEVEQKQEMETNNKEEEVEQKQEMETDNKEEEEELEYTEEEIAYNKIDDVMFNKKCLNTEMKNKVNLLEEEEEEEEKEKVEQEMEIDSKEKEVEQEQELETDNKEEESTQKDKRRKKKNKNVVAISV